MSDVGAPANWYNDPDGSGGLRYWNGGEWTEFRAPPPPPVAYVPYPAWGPPPWKGAQLGRPQDGPGALANPGRRLAARLLDGLLLLPVFALILTLTLLIAAPHFGPIFPRLSANNTTVQQVFPGFFWIEITVLACIVVTGVVLAAYETVATAKYGRTLGKAWLHIRPLRVDGGTLGWGGSFGRVAIYGLSWILSWIGLIDPLWCLWDDKRQCLHDKVVGSIVVNDGNPVGLPTPR
jgi:uncharacterized RDD family membrane protein YckC